jgi:hypothetical protein
MSPLDSFWNGVLSLLTPLVTPDWGKLIGLIPFLLLGLVLLFVVLQARAWMRMSASRPVRGPKGRPRPMRPLILGHLVVVALGIATVALAFVAGSRDPSWTGATSPFGLVVNVPLLILGLALIIGTLGNGIRLWERSGRDDVEPDAIDTITVWVREHPGRTKRIVAFFAGVLIAATGLALGTAPGATTPQPVDVAVVPVLLLGLVLAVGSVGSAIAALWTHDPDFDTPAGDDSSAVVSAGH